ncbi:MAG: ZIP family metal transporter [bacterium]|nr:ZIP family metal transporter [bacterium]
MTLLWIILASTLGGLIALLAALFILKGKLWSHERSHLFLSFAAGTLITVSFLDMLPEAIHGLTELNIENAVESAALFVLFGFLLFFSIEKLILWYHCHEEKCDVHSSVPMVLIGDTLHNFLDGIAIAVAFLIDPSVGIATTLAIFVHEIPQEIADFSILLNSGMSQKKALMFNLLSSLVSLVGALVAYLFATHIESAVPLLIAIAAGGFIYIAAADIVPEIHKETRRFQMALQFAAFTFGLIIVLLITKVFAH